MHDLSDGVCSNMYVEFGRGRNDFRQFARSSAWNFLIAEAAVARGERLEMPNSLEITWYGSGLCDERAYGTFHSKSEDSVAHVGEFGRGLDIQEAMASMRGEKFFQCENCRGG